jgi:hypothetical protein
MVEKCNDTVKNGTIKTTIYETAEEMRKDIIRFMLFYNLNRRHTGLRKEVKELKTPMDAMEYYYKHTPNLFKEPPDKFREKLENIRQINNIDIDNIRKI